MYVPTWGAGVQGVNPEAFPFPFPFHLHDPMLCREGSPEYGSGLDDDLMQRLLELAEHQGRGVDEFLATLLEEHATRRAREEARERILDRMKRGMFEVRGGTWTREELYER